MNWIEHFKNRPLVDLTPFADEKISGTERERIEYSMAQFQRGESSEAQDFLRKAAQFSFIADDSDFFQASKLFVKEENFHSDLLKVFMEQMGIKLAGDSWTDNVFRWMRLPGDIAWTSRVLLTAEILAQIYYPALYQATTSRMLQAICDRIIDDEEFHILFQTERIARALQCRSKFVQWGCAGVGKVLFWGTAVVVWFEHRSVLNYSLSFGQYLLACRERYQFAMMQIRKGLLSKRKQSEMTTIVLD